MGIKLKSKAERAIRILLAGHPIVHDGREYYLGDDNNLVHKAVKFSLGSKKGPETVYLNVHVDLKWFLDMVESLSEDYYIGAMANVTLTEMNRGG
jgi:hypothetical protein